MQFHLQIRIDLGKIDGFYINVTRTEIKAHITGIPPKLVNDLKCHSDTYLMTCASDWDHVSIICLVPFIILVVFISEISSEIDFDEYNYR